MIGHTVLYARHIHRNNLVVIILALHGEPLGLIIRELTHVRYLHRHVPGTRTKNIGLTPQYLSTQYRINVARIQPHLQSFTFINFGAMAAQQSSPPVQESLPRVPDIQFRVLVIGRANAGKTSLLQRVCDTTESPKIYKCGPSGIRERVRSCFQRHFRSHRPARFLNSTLQQRLAMLLLVDDG